MPTMLARSIGPGSHLARMFRPLVNPFVPDRAVPVRVLAGPARGLQMVIEPRREKFYWTGSHEPDVQRALARLLSPGATFWDVGAHVGFFSLLAARLVGATGTVHAFEPLDENRARLETAARLNGFDNVRAHALAVSSVSGEGTLHRHGSTLMWTLVPTLGEVEGRQVECVTLDGLTERLGVPTVVKIDVEGAELDVLRAGSRLLKRRPALLIELTRASQRAALESLLPDYRLEAVSDRHAVLT